MVSDQVLPEISRCTVSWHWASKVTLAMLLLIAEERDFDQKLYIIIFSKDVQLVVFQIEEKIKI